MDVLLSLPIISYLAAPATTASWSTSLNLLFFYVTWSALVLSHRPLHIEVAGTLAARLVFWLAPSLLFLLFDTLLPSVAGGLKLYGAASLPLRGRGGGGGRGAAGVAPLLRQILLGLANVAVLAAAQAALSAAAARLLGRPLFRTSAALPLPWQVLRHVAALYAAREALAYLVHRYVLHPSHSHSSSFSFSLSSPSWWRRSIGGGAGNNKSNALAALHARYAHGHAGGGGGGGAAPYSLLAYADHPLPLLAGRLAPAYLPAALLVRPHVLTFLLFTALTTAEDTLAASGYAAPVSGLRLLPLPLGGLARRTAAHYAAAGRGNYGPWGLLDWACGTGIGGGGGGGGGGGASDVVDDATSAGLEKRQRGGKKA